MSCLSFLTNVGQLPYLRKQYYSANKQAYDRSRSSLERYTAKVQQWGFGATKAVLTKAVFLDPFSSIDDYVIGDGEDFLTVSDIVSDFLHDLKGLLSFCYDKWDLLLCGHVCFFYICILVGVSLKEIIIVECTTLTMLTIEIVVFGLIGRILANTMLYSVPLFGACLVACLVAGLVAGILHLPWLFGWRVEYLKRDHPDTFSSFWSNVPEEQITQKAIQKFFSLNNLIKEGQNPNNFPLSTTRPAFWEVKQEFDIVDRKLNRLLGLLSSYITSYTTVKDFHYCLSFFQKRSQHMYMIDIQDGFDPSVFVPNKALASFLGYDGGKTLLHKAIYHRNTDIVQYILQRPEGSFLIHLASRDGRTPLHEAVSVDNERGRQIDLTLIKMLLKAGADPNIHDHVGNSILRDALKLKHTELVILLLDYGAKFADHGQEGEQMLKNVDEEDVAFFKTCHMKHMRWLLPVLKYSPTKSFSDVYYLGEGFRYEFLQKFSPV